MNSELVQLYWSIGRDILERQEKAGWGGKVVDQLSADLRREFPDSKGLSASNLKYMRAFAQAWPDALFVQGPLAQITWWHNLALLEKLKQPEQRIWYAKKTIENGWSRNVLVIHIERQLFEAQGSAATNFGSTLPAPQSDLARETLKDSYKLDFLGIGDEAEERTIERGLVRHIRDFLIELGQGFAFVGNQVPLEVGQEGIRLDLLFYHLKLRA